MPLDAICLSALRVELFDKLIGARIDKVQQPERDQIILSLRSGHSGALRLLLSAGTSDARVHFTARKFDNPQSPPMFCMLLRKHLSGAGILDISQPSLDRVLEFSIESSSAIGDKSVMRLIVELIGRMSNIILLDCEGRIVDCLRRMGSAVDDKRAVQPGLFYKSPPAQAGKIDPYTVIGADVGNTILNDKHVDKWILNTFSGFSPLIARELSHRAYGAVDVRPENVSDNGAALFREIKNLLEQEHNPWLISDSAGKLIDFSYTKIEQYESACDVVRYESFSELLDFYFTRASQDNRMRQKSSATLKSMTTLRDRLTRKLALQKTEVLETSKRDYNRECGDIITANLHLMKKGQNVLVADDFYSDAGGKREIALDFQKTPQQNAARYYKLYTKAKNAAVYLAQQIENGEKELLYFESVIEQIRRVDSEQDLSEIRAELSELGYIKVAVKGKGKARQKESSPIEFKSSSGFKILVGRNNTQNDKLTLKTAARTDVWLHTQKIHGAHVIVSLDGKSIDDVTLFEAASIAAYYSAARDGGNVPVDYTLVKYVKKPSGSRPGMVIYTEQKTIMATPDEGLVGRLRVE